MRGRKAGLYDGGLDQMGVENALPADGSVETNQGNEKEGQPRGRIHCLMRNNPVLLLDTRGDVLYGIKEQVGERGRSFRLSWPP